MKILLITNTCSASSSPKDGAFPGLSHCVVLLVLRQHLGQAKITDLHPHLALHQNVSSGQVSVDVSLNGKVVHTLKYEHGHMEKEKWFIYALVLILYIHSVAANYFMANILLILPFNKAQTIKTDSNTQIHQFLTTVCS